MGNSQGYTVPSRKSVIVKHYYENWVYDDTLKKSVFRTKIKPAFFVDIGEPACFRCGYYDYGFEEHDYIEGKTKISPYVIWNKARFLQRCHIIPSVLGGGSESDNIVLLCKPCHRSNPNTTSLELYQKWMDGGESYIERGCNQAKGIFDAMGFGEDQALFSGVAKVLRSKARFEKFKEYLYTNTTTIPAHPNANFTSFVVALTEFYRAEQLSEGVKNDNKRAD